MFGPAAIYNSVYGIGLVVLLIYAYYVLNESITRRELLGAVLIIIGTVAVGMVGIFYTTEEPVILYPNFFTSLYILLPIATLLIIVGYKYKKLTLLLFAPMGGMLSAMGTDFLYIGNLDGGFAPNPSIMIPIYVVGLLLGTVSFLLSQVAFYRGADASKYVPFYNALFIMTPFIYELFIFQITPTDLTGFLIKLPFICIILLGIYFIIGILIKTIKKPPTQEVLAEDIVTSD